MTSEEALKMVSAMTEHDRGVVLSSIIALSVVEYGYAETEKRLAATVQTIHDHMPGAPR